MQACKQASPSHLCSGGDVEDVAAAAAHFVVDCCLCGPLYGVGVEVTLSPSLSSLMSSSEDHLWPLF